MRRVGSTFSAAETRAGKQEVSAKPRCRRAGRDIAATLGDRSVLQSQTIVRALNAVHRVFRTPAWALPVIGKPDDRKAKKRQGGGNPPPRLLADVEAELDDVAIFDDVFFPFDAKLALFLRGGFRTQLN